ncbi:MAG TPA: glutathione synthase [Burkholderiaceae bacterium]|jgi:glutathione synthase|nr:glutathione synthase [Burkholderiaceae bacterium]
MTSEVSALFVLDPLDELKEAKDSSIAMMREMARRNHQLWACEVGGLAWREGLVQAVATRVDVLPQGAEWFSRKETVRRPLEAFDVVLMRKDPPFDMEYLVATYLLEAAVRRGARVFNDPRALRDHNEKLAIAEFAHYAPPTLVSRDPEALREFHGEHRDIVVKPLDGMGGRGVFRLAPQDPNLGVILETATQGGQKTVMAQRFIPEIASGDKRILLVAGRPVPYALARTPRPGESRGNLAAGGIPRAQPLSERDRAIAAALGPALADRGLLLVGLDVIGDYLTEINVTSPTCFVEIKRETGFNVALMFVEALERQILQ